MTDAEADAALEKYFSYARDMADSTGDGTLLRDIALMWEEKARAHGPFKGLSSDEVDIPDEWADTSTGNRHGYIRVLRILNQGGSYIDNGWQQLRNAVELAQRLDERLEKHVKLSEDQYKADQATNRDPILHKIAELEAERQDLVRRLADLSPEEKNSENQRAKLEGDLSFNESYLEMERAGLAIVGDDRLAENLQSPTRILLLDLRQRFDEVGKVQDTAEARRRKRHVNRWSRAFGVAAGLFIIGKISDSILKGNSILILAAAIAVAIALWLFDACLLEPKIKRSAMGQMRDDMLNNIESIWKAKSKVRLAQATFNAELRKYGIDELTLIPAPSHERPSSETVT